jgi:S1-C subfamily serine protease
VPPPQPVIVPPPQTPAPVARKPYFGIILRDLDDNAGVSVVGIADDSPAIEAGVDGGDTILSFNGRQVKSARELQTLFDAATPDETVTLEISRDAKTVTVKIKVGSKP